MEKEARENATDLKFENDTAKKYKLKQDILIKAGTVFELAPSIVQRYDRHHESVIGLTKDSSGSLAYFIDPNDPGLSEWFEKVE